MPNKARTPPPKPPDQVAALKVFGESLRELMADRDWTPGTLAERMGVSYDTIVKYQNGKRDPQLYVLLELTEILNVSLDRLIKGKSSSRPHLRVVPPDNR